MRFWQPRPYSKSCLASGDTFGRSSVAQSVKECLTRQCRYGLRRASAKLAQPGIHQQSTPDSSHKIRSSISKLHHAEPFAIPYVPSSEVDLLRSWNIDLRNTKHHTDVRATMRPIIASYRSIIRTTFRHKPSTQFPSYYPFSKSPSFSRGYASSTIRPQFKPLGQTLKLPSGRILGYHTSGVPDGIPVIYIHGNPDSGIQIRGDLEVKVAKKLGIQWIGPDRPGIGLSTMTENQGVKDYSQDVRSLVDHLQLKECFMLGTSGGTGYTLACARDPPPQLRGIGICAGVGPVECGFESMGDIIKQAWDYWRDHSAELTAYIEAEYTHLARASDATELRERIEADLRSYLTGDELAHNLQENMMESAVQGHRQIYAQGAAAHAYGIAVNMRSWGFKVEDIQFPGIKFWYGSDDMHTTPTMGKYMAERLPGSVYKEYLGKSHLTIWNKEDLEDMLRGLVGAGR